MTHPDTLPAMERRSRSRVIPGLIDHHVASPDVSTLGPCPRCRHPRLELVTALDASWPRWLDLGVAAAGAGALPAVRAVVDVSRSGSGG